MKLKSATIMIVALSSCASVFPYKWYGLDVDKQLLLGPSPKDDLPIIVCKADDQVKGKCVVMKTEDFDRLMTDYADKSERLKKCGQ